MQYLLRPSRSSYISRLGIVTVATLLQLSVWFTHSYLRAFAAPTPAWRWLTLAHSLVGAAGALAGGSLRASTRPTVNILLLLRASIRRGNREQAIDRL